MVLQSRFYTLLFIRLITLYHEVVWFVLLLPDARPRTKTQKHKLSVLMPALIDYMSTDYSVNDILYQQFAFSQTA